MSGEPHSSNHEEPGTAPLEDLNPSTDAVQGQPAGELDYEAHFVVEEDPAALMPPPRAWEPDEPTAEGPPAVGHKEDAGDTDSLADESEVEALSEERREIDSATETSYRRIIVELKRVENEVRCLLEDKDPRRKRKLTGTRRWLELEEDLLAWRFSDRFDEPTIQHLLRLVARRHALFRRLRFLAGTRPTWNT